MKKKLKYDTNTMSQPADSFNLGKHKTKGGQIVDVKAKCGDWAWCWLADGTMTTHSIVSLAPLAKFDHLRNLPIDTKVVVWRTELPKIKVNAHLAEISDHGNLVYTFANGTTSFTQNPDEAIEHWDNCEVWN